MSKVNKESALVANEWLCKDNNFIQYLLPDVSKGWSLSQGKRALMVDEVTVHRDKIWIKTNINVKLCWVYFDNNTLR